MAVIYDNKVKSKGALVDSFEGESMFILFGDNAPDTLKDFCYSVEVTPVQGEIKPGSKLVIDGQEYKITMVGDVARENLNNLGHVTYSFNGSGECLPGSICVEKTDVPTLKVGSTISITE